MYANHLKLHRGVDNKIQFRFLNQEQKPLNVSSSEMTFRLIDPTNSVVLLQKSLSDFLPTTGIMQLELLADELTDIQAQQCTYSLTYTENGLVLPVFTDTMSGAYGKIDVVDDVLPIPATSTEVTIPSFATTPYYSSDIQTTSYSTTFQFILTDYTGPIEIQGSVNAVDWYTIAQTTLSNSLGEFMTSTGFHPHMRVKFTPSQGTVTSIKYR